MYDGSLKGLTAALTRFAGDPSIARRLADQPAPVLGDPMEAYEHKLPPVWHRRSQGGLATAALARVEHVRFPEPEIARHRQVLQSLIRRTPDSVVAAVNKVLPAGVRDRIRSVSDWDWETEDQRQHKEGRWATVRRRIAEGELGANASPHVSIVIPCFNQGAFIDDCLLSIFEQSFDDYDVVIIDDGSDDGQTPQILDSLRFERVVVRHQDNVGLPGARNRGIEAARGEYVVTLDADDELAPEYLAKLSGALDSDPDLAFAHCWARIFGDYQAIWATRPFNRFQLLLSNSIVGCVMLKKTAWEAVGGYDESMLEGNEDWDLWIRLSEAGYHSEQIREPLFWYRKHGVSMSVETEARYESVLTSLSTRLPSIYTLEHMRTVKHESYPMLCVLTDADSFAPPFEDLCVIRVTHEDVSSVVDDVHSKYVVWWSSDTDADPAVLASLCDMLEQDESLGAAETSDSNAIRVVRTWSLRDPDAPSRIEQSDSGGASVHRLECGQFPSDQWQVPSRMGDIDVHRQRPEESGVMPVWVGA
jgi:GT2 family glycosyltransferase